MTYRLHSCIHEIFLCASRADDLVRLMAFYFGIVLPKHTKYLSRVLSMIARRRVPIDLMDVPNVALTTYLRSAARLSQKYYRARII